MKPTWSVLTLNNLMRISAPLLLSVVVVTSAASDTAADPAVRVAEARSDAQEYGSDPTSHGNHDDHNDGDHKDAVKLDRDQIKKFGIRTEAATSGPIAVTVERPAHVKFNQDLLAHVVPRVSGIAETVVITEGDRVTEGQIIAVLDSRELADAKALYLAGLERMQLAQEEFDRQKTLRDKKITSEKSFLTARTALAEARIALTSATQKLYALGYDKAALEKFSDDEGEALTKYVVRAPISGVVINRHLVRGEFVETDLENERELFTIADVTSVWIDIALYPHDLPNVQSGQKVRITTDYGASAEAVVSFVTPHVSEETHTATARVVLKNNDLTFRPGELVQAFINVSGDTAAVRVPKSAVQTIDGRKVVFVAEGSAFHPRTVDLGRESADIVEVAKGLEAGERVVAEGSFVLKSELAKAGFESGHNH